MVLQVKKLINFIKKRYLLHRELVKILEEMDSEYTNVLYYTEVRWLSKGSMASRMYYLFLKIREFFQNNNMVEKFAFLFDDAWALHLAFLSNICSHLNKLNIQLQGKHIILRSNFKN